MSKRFFSSNITLFICVLYAVVLSIGLSMIFGIRYYHITSGSMAPKIPVHSIVAVNSNASTVEVGDVIAYRLANGTTIVHRVAAVRNDCYETRGDANSSNDISPVLRQQICGICIFSVSPRVMGICAVISVLAGLLVSEIQQIIEKKRGYSGSER